MSDLEFIEEVFELAFGANAIDRDFTREEVLSQLNNFSNDALSFEEANDIIVAQYSSIDGFLKKRKEYLDKF